MIFYSYSISNKSITIIIIFTNTAAINFLIEISTSYVSVIKIKFQKKRHENFSRSILFLLFYSMSVTPDKPREYKYRLSEQS